MKLPQRQTTDQRIFADLLCVLTILLMPTCVVSEELVIHPQAAPGPLDNPLKGWCPYTDAGEITQPYSMVFQYVPGAALNLAKASIDSSSGMPDWLIKKGVKMRRDKEHSGGLAPDYDDVRMISATEKFIAALGQRYTLPIVFRKSATGPSFQRFRSRQKMNIMNSEVTIPRLIGLLVKNVVSAALFVLLSSSSMAGSKPNIVYIICDDLGYGDVHCLAPETSKIPTPNADRLASEGMIFTDAHSGSSVCSPTRYGIMTGRYSWRTWLQKGVVTGFAPSLIAAKRPTVASFLKEQGYATAAIGKWHLNFEYLNPKTGKQYTQKQHDTPPIGAKIPDGPIHRGFDYYHGFHHARNMEAVIENDEVIAHDEAINMLPRLTRKSVEYIESRAGKDEPFFLYLPLGSPHTPIVPSPEWQGKSGLGLYGDFVMQTDNVIGEVSVALAKHGLAENTLVIFTSDNGCSKAAGIPALAEKGHLVSAHLRGSKADIWDGGHRIPFIVRWPGKVEPGTTSGQLICLTDLFATTSDILGEPFPETSCEDSVSFLQALSGKPIQSTRAGVIHHSFSGHFAYRTGKWKLILARGSGGWTSPKENEVPKGSMKAQLYDLDADPGEQNNLYTSKPEIAERLLSQLTAEVRQGRSTTGQTSQNDVENIVLWKSEAAVNRQGAKPAITSGKKNRKQ
tara:strand:+ start:67152 stop:69188 length:2037 start_codon:yes stop_codon:yes gene_type:complete